MTDPAEEIYGAPDLSSYEVCARENLLRLYALDWVSEGDLTPSDLEELLCGDCIENLKEYYRGYFEEELETREEINEACARDYRERKK